LRGHEVLKVDN